MKPGDSIKTASRRTAVLPLAAVVASLLLALPSIHAQTLAEALDTTNLVWTTGGDARWFVQTTNTYDGVDAVRSGIVGPNQTSWIETTVMGPATMSHREQLPWVIYLSWNLSINGESRDLMMTGWGGPLTNVWFERTYDLGEGTNVIRWSLEDDSPTETQAFAALDQFALSSPRPLAITYHPGDRAVYSGVDVLLHTAAVGTPPLHYQWQKDGTNITGATDYSLTIAQATTNDTGVYSVAVSNAQESVTSSNATLTVLPPTAPFITYQSTSITIYSGERFAIGVIVDGSPPFLYQWRKDAIGIVGATNHALHFDRATTNDTGVYSILVSNLLGFVVSSNAMLTVLPPTPPFLSYEPVSATKYTGGSVTFMAWVDGSPPFTYQWRKDGTNLTGATRYDLTLTNLSLDDTGSYSLAVNNEVGGVESSNAVLTVVQSVAPVITRQPRSLDVADGVFTWLSLETSGIYDPNEGLHAKWTKEPSVLLPACIWEDGTTRALFGNVTTNDAGVYFASLRNYAGAAESRDVLLTVLPSLTNKGSWGQGAADVFVTNGLAFLAQGTNGVAILSVSNPASPLVLGSYHTQGDALAVQLSGGLAFVAEGPAGLEILSVTNPTHPVLLGGYDTPRYALDVVVRSNLAFVADGSAGLVILDVTDPTQPTAVGGFATNLRVGSVCLCSNFVCAGSSSDSQGAVLLDVSNPALPLEMGRLTRASTALAARDSLIFVGSRDGLAVYDVGDPAQPILTGLLRYYDSHMSVPVFDVQVVGDLAYVVASNAGQPALLVLNVRDPRDPVPVGYVALPESARHLCVDGNLVYVAGTESALQIIGTPFDTRPVTPPLLSLSTHDGMKLQLRGRRGLHYDLEYADGLDGSPWQPLPTFLLTNETAVLELPSPAGTRFFRLRQLD